LEMNGGALLDDRVEIINGDAYQYLEKTKTFFDIVICDFPDPKSIELARLYSFEFYKMCQKQLRPEGLICIQSGSPYYATTAFACINKTVQKAGFQTIQMHNQVLTLGQWGWTLGAKHIPQDSLKKRLHSLEFDGIDTRWLNHEAMLHISSFGKSMTKLDTSKIQVNRIHDPILSTYYRKGNWDWY